MANVHLAESMVGHIPRKGKPQVAVRETQREAETDEHPYPQRNRPQSEVKPFRTGAWNTLQFVVYY